MAPRDLARRLWTHLEEDDIAGLSAELAFRSFLELFPFFVFLTVIGDALAGALHIQNPAQQVLSMLTESLPSETADPIRQQLETVIGTRPPGFAVLSVLGALWIAAGGGASLLKATNRVYRIKETRPWWERQVVGLGLSLFAGFVVAFAVGLLGAGQLIAQAAGASEPSGWFAAIAGFARWPLLLAVLMTEAAVIFRLAPDSRLPWRWVTPGAAVFGTGWFAASFLFVLYVKFAGGYASSYGVIGGVVVILLWLQLTMYALLSGAEVNAQLEDPASVERAGGHPAHEQGAAAASRPTRALQGNLSLSSRRESARPR
jgi:membrane protein